MTKKLLSESTAVPTKAGNGRWRSVLITPGQGSSGFYSEDVLREYGPIALRKGAKSFVTHNRTENGEPDPFAMWGFLAEDSYYEDGVGLVGVIEVLPSWRDKVEEVAPHVALSVYVSGEADEAGNVTKFVEDVQNGIDMVSYPGRPGSSLVEQMVESAARMARESEENPTVTSAVEKEKETKKMDELKAAIEALTAQVSALVAKENAAVAEAAQAEADKDAGRNAVEAYDAAVKAIDAADLPEKVVESLRMQAKEGADVTALISQAVAIKEASLESLRLDESAPGREFGTPTEYKLKGYGN